MKIELKWSDEDVWKFWKDLPADQTPEQALEACRLQWEETKKHAKLNYECEFRCTNKSADASPVGNPTSASPNG